MCNLDINIDYKYRFLSVVFNIIFPIKHTVQGVNFFELDIAPEEMTEFKQNLIRSFEYLTESLFIETSRDNF